MNQKVKIINDIIKEIQSQNSLVTIGLKGDMKIVKDLGFSSLDVAQLIATLELEFGMDPFAEDVSIMDVHTLDELYQLY